MARLRENLNWTIYYLGIGSVWPMILCPCFLDTRRHRQLISDTEISNGCSRTQRIEHNPKGFLSGQGCFPKKVDKDLLDVRIALVRLYIYAYWQGWLKPQCVIG
jgi:hypothetical protein